MGKELAKSIVELVMRKVRVDKAIGEIKSKVLFSKGQVR